MLQHVTEAGDVYHRMSLKLASYVTECHRSWRDKLQNVTEADEVHQRMSMKLTGDVTECH